MPQVPSHSAILRSYPGPSCQKRKRCLPGRSRTVSPCQSEFAVAASIRLISAESGRFEPSQQSLDLWSRQERVDQQVKMFGHVDECHQLKRQLATCPVNVRRQSLSEITLIQQWQAMIAGEGQFMEVAGFVIMPDGLSLTAAACASPHTLENVFAYGYGNRSS